MSIPEARKGTPDPTLDEVEFRKRFLQQFQDPAFDPLKGELQRIADAARTLLEAVRAKRHGTLVAAGGNLKEPRQK